MANELATWREQFNIDKAKQSCRQSAHDKYSVAVMACGGLLDTLAAIRAGLAPIWGSDTCKLSKQLWKDLVGNECYDDAFKLNTESLRRPKILKTGFPCPDYTGLGSGLGSDGETGDLYVKQADLILKISPDAAIIEQTDNAPNINNGEEVKQLIAKLSTDYVVHHTTLSVWQYGDASHRARFFIVALHRRLGRAAHNYNFPTPTFDQQHYHIAADIALPDDEVPAMYVLEGSPVELYEWREPRPGKLHHLGNYGQGVGHCHSPNPLHSWWGVPNTQLTSNGGARRVMLDWRPGQPVTHTRLTTPIETVRMASLSESYLKWLQQFDTQDSTLRRLVNNGVPLRTSTAIDQTVISLLQQAGIKHDVPANMTEKCRCLSQCGHEIPNRAAMACDSQCEWSDEIHAYIRSMLVDSGASGSLNYTDIEQCLQRSRTSQFQIAVAKGDVTMQGSRDGMLPIFVLNTSNRQGFLDKTPLPVNTTTVNDLRTELFSLDGPYRNGKFNILLRQPDYECGSSELYREATDTTPELRIPLRYDWAKSGWWLDYIPQQQATAEHHTLLMQHHEDMKHTKSAANSAHLYRNTYSVEAANECYGRISCHSAVKSIMRANETDVTIIARHPDERNAKGVKSGLKHGRQKLPLREFHRKYAHIGNCSETCDICRMIKGAMRRISKTIDPYRETRPAHTWSMDTITFSHRSLNGSKYLTALRCKATGFIKNIYLYLRSDIVTQLEQWILTIRADPAFSYLPYKAVSVIVTDEPGEWSRRSVAFQAMLLRVKHVDVVYVTPETSKEAGHAEATNSIMEETTKAILMQQNLPEDHWEVCAESAEWLLNRFANLATDATAPIDGDQASPLELVTGGRYSRRQIYRELSYYVMPGTPCLVHMPKIRGSTLAPKVRWGIAWKMYREQVIFLCPFVASTFRSKSFTAFDLRDNMNYAQFLGLPKARSTRKSIALPSDYTEKVQVHLLPARKSTKAGVPPVVQLHTCNDDGVQHIVLREPVQSEQAISQQPRLQQSDGPCNQLGGSVQVYEHTEQQLTTDPSQKRQMLQQKQDTKRQHRQDQFEMIAEEHVGDQQAEESAGRRTVTDKRTEPGSPCRTPLTLGTEANEDSLQNSSVQGQQQATEMEAGSQPEQNTDKSKVQFEYEHDTDYFGEFDIDEYDHDEDERDQTNLDQIAEILAERDACTVGVNLSFDKLCKHYGIPFELKEVYYKWLLDLQTDGRMRYNQDQIPRGRGCYLKLGLKIPAPHGRQWRDLMKEKNLKYNEKNKKIIIQAHHMVLEAINQTAEGVKAVEALARHWDKQEIEAHQARKVKKRRKPAAEISGGKQPPATISKALRDENRDEAFKWLESINKEFDGLCEMGVIEHNYTYQQLRENGIDTHPIPFSVCLTYKYDKAGEIDRYKTRMALAGHRGNMQPGVHFDRTYSSTPVQYSSKILQALMVKYKLRRLAFDIKMAYCHAKIPKEQLIAVRYPEGFRRYNEAGEELFGILRKNLYGAPQAGRLWEKERNAVIMELFNKDGWKCKRCVKEPCLFVITKDGKRTWMLVWTDDCDLVGESDDHLQQIHKIINDKWECKLVDPAYMLGIRREVTTAADGNMTVELTMTAFIDAMTESFKQYVLRKAVNTPVPDGFFIWRDAATPEAESKRVLDRGYQRLFGMLLWAARGTFTECLQGCSLLGRVMSAPTEEAWSAACHMLTYMQQHKTHGIRYSTDGNSAPICMTDSSNKPDPTDSKCQYGYCHLWQGAVIIAVSKKLAHVGLSAAHNEYMAAHWANRATMWLRDLLCEMGLEDVVSKPTDTYGDNKAANLLCEEDIVTCGNQFMQVPYHFNKEAVQQGVVTMHYVPTADNIADLFTKSVSRQVLERLLPLLLGYLKPK